MPNVLEQKLQQGDAGHRALADDDIARGELAGWAFREQHHAAHRAVTRDCKIGQQQVPVGLASVFNRRDDADVEGASGHFPIEISRNAVDQIGVEMDDSAIDRPVDRVAVDIGNAADFHQAAAALGLRSKTRRML